MPLGRVNDDYDEQFVETECKKEICFNHLGVSLWRLAQYGSMYSKKLFVFQSVFLFVLTSTLQSTLSWIEKVK